MWLGIYPLAGLSTNNSYLSSSITDPHLIHGDVGLLRVVWADSGQLEELWDVEEDGVENHRKDEMTGTELTSWGEGGKGSIQ